MLLKIFVLVWLEFLMVSINKLLLDFSVGKIGKQFQRFLFLKILTRSLIIWGKGFFLLIHLLLIEWLVLSLNFQLWARRNQLKNLLIRICIRRGSFVWIQTSFQNGLNRFDSFLFEIIRFVGFIIVGYWCFHLNFKFLDFFII